MKPIECPDALKFFESVFKSEKEALIKEITRLFESALETDNEKDDNEKVIRKLKIRLSLITEYARSDTTHFLIESKEEHFICPRCLVHNSSETLLTLDAFMDSSGAGEWRCRSCGLRYSPIAFNAIPTPIVPLSEASK